MSRPEPVNPVRALTPPMGWNSFDSYGTSVTEAEVLDNATFLAQRMRRFGWDTVVIDIQWYDPTARAGGYNEEPAVEIDGYGRQQPAPNRFPSSAGGAGFAPLAERIHALGLRFGLHIMRGIPRQAVELDLPVAGTSWTASQIADPGTRCRWNPDNDGLDHDHPGAQAYYDSQVAMFAAWGVDFVKADDMLSPYRHADVEAYARAIARSGRPIMLSLSPGSDVSLAQLDHLRAHATMWRISGDLWDRWSDLEAQFARAARWAPWQGPTGWADADMLPLGHLGVRAEVGDDRLSALTFEEQRTMVTLWTIARSPLMVGGDLPTSLDATIGLLTNADVLRMHGGTADNREVLREGDLVVWTAHATDTAGERYAAVFWLGDRPTRVDLPLPAVTDAVIDIATATVVDVWSGQNVAADAEKTGSIVLDIPAHGCRLLRLVPVSRQPSVPVAAS